MTDHRASSPGAAPRAAGDPAGPLDEATRLTNRIALLTFLTAIGFIAGLVLLPHAVTGDSGGLVRFASSLPLLAAAWTAVLVRRGRRRLRGVRRMVAEPSPDPAEGRR